MNSNRIVVDKKQQYMKTEKTNTSEYIPASKNERDQEISSQNIEITELTDDFNHPVKSNIAQSTINQLQKCKKNPSNFILTILLTVTLVLLLILLLSVYSSLQSSKKQIICRQSPSQKINQIQSPPSFVGINSNPNQVKYQKQTNSAQVLKTQSEQKNDPKVAEMDFPKAIVSNSQANIIYNPVIDDSNTPFREHNTHQNKGYPYESLGVRKIGDTFNFSLVGDKQYEYQKAMDSLIRPYNDTDCEYKRYGDQHDGGYILCDNFVKKSQAIINLGVQARDGFGCQLSSAFKIPNYQFDCTNKIEPQCDTNQGLNLFQPACLSEYSGHNKNYQFYSLKDMLVLRNLTKKHITLKIDIEAAQFPGFRSFPMADLQYIDQIVMEIHFFESQKNHERFWGNVDIINSLKENFISINLHMTNFGCGKNKGGYYRSSAVEVSLVNKRLIKINSDTRSYKQNPLNAINNRRKRDCQMPSQ